MAMENFDKYRKSAKYKAIRADLLHQLALRGTNEQYYLDLVSDYMNFWVTKNLLNEDIQKRGVVVEYHNGGGQSGWKRNESITEQIRVNTQMLHILAALEIKPADMLDEEM